MTIIDNYEKISLEFTPVNFPQHLLDLRRSGREELKTKGFPNRGVEGWRNISTERYSASLYPPADIKETPLSQPLAGVEIKNRIRFINGHIVSSLPSFSGSTEIKALSLRGDENFPAELLGTLGGGTPFTALNNSLFTDALYLEAGESTTPQTPIELEYTTAGDAALSSQNRTVIELRKGAKLHIIQRFIGSGSHEKLSNSVTEIILHDGAELTHTIVVDEQADSSHFHSIFVHEKAKSRYSLLSLAFSGAFSRTDLYAELDGEGARADLRGLFIGSGSRIHNIDSKILHRGSKSSSSSLFKAVGSENSHAVFRGAVEVESSAKGTEAFQSYPALLLSEKSRVSTEPHLIINTDEVSCSHGATVGKLDEKQLFYLQSRGFNPEDAQKILVESFAAEILNPVSEPLLKEELLNRVSKSIESINGSRKEEI